MTKLLVNLIKRFQSCSLSYNKAVNPQQNFVHYRETLNKMTMLVYWNEVLFVFLGTNNYCHLLQKINGRKCRRALCDEIIT